MPLASREVVKTEILLWIRREKKSWKSGDHDTPKILWEM